MSGGANLPLVFLPGMMCDERLFAPQIASLSADRPVSVLDLGGADTMAGLAADVLARAPARFALAGLSMGGIVAMEVVRQAPGRVAGLALLDTNPLAEAEAVRARRAAQMERARSGRLADVIRDEMAPNYLADPRSGAAIRELCLDMALSLGPEVFCRQSLALRDRPDQTATLAGFDRPALVLCGRADALCPVTRHELMHGLLPNSTLTIVDEAGHLPTLEKPAETTAALRRWLNEIDSHEH